MFRRSAGVQKQSWTQALFLILFTSDVQLDVYNKAELRDSANVMGVIWGSVEPGKLRNCTTCTFNMFRSIKLCLLNSII